MTTHNIDRSQPEEGATSTSTSIHRCRSIDGSMSIDRSIDRSIISIDVARDGRGRGRRARVRACPRLRDAMMTTTTTMRATPSMTTTTTRMAKMPTRTATTRTKAVSSPRILVPDTDMRGLSAKRAEVIEDMGAFAAGELSGLLKDPNTNWQPQDYLPDPSSVDFLDEVRGRESASARESEREREGGFRVRVGDKDVWRWVCARVRVRACVMRVVCV